MEAQIKHQPNQFWAFNFSASYDDASVKSNNYQFDPATGNQGLDVVPGERLRLCVVSSWTGTARYEHPVADALRGCVPYDISRK